MILILHKNRRLLLFLMGVFLSTLGSGVTSTILPIFVLKRYHSAIFFAIVLAAREVPVTLCAPWLGAVVDRVGGNKTTLIALSLSALAVGSNHLTRLFDRCWWCRTRCWGMEWFSLLPRWASTYRI